MGSRSRGQWRASRQGLLLPKKLTREFLLVDLVNNIDRLAESEQEVLARVREQAHVLHAPRLRRTAQHYGNVRTRKFFSQELHAN